MKNSRRDLALLSMVLILLLALAAGVRIYKIGSQSLWSDEGNSVALAMRSLSQITRDTAHDIHPPLYYWMLHLWTRVMGTGETSLRLMSAALGVLLVLAIAELGRRLYGESTGLAAAFIAALAAFQVYYSQEARMYILLALLSSVSVLCFWSFITREGRYLPGSGARSSQPGPQWQELPLPGFLLVLTWVAGLYTHYLFPLVIALLSGLYALWLILTWRRGYPARRLVRWLLLLALALVCYAPWLPTALHQLSTWPTAGSTMRMLDAVWASLALLMAGPAGQTQPGWHIWLLAGLALLGALPWRALLALFNPRPRPGQPVEPEIFAFSHDDDENLPSSAARLKAEPPQPEIMAALGGLGPAAAAAAEPPRAFSLPPVPAPLSAAPEPARVDVRGKGPAHPEYWIKWLTPLTWAVAPLAVMLVFGLYRDSYLKFLLVASPAVSLLLGRSIVAPAGMLLRSEQHATTRPGILGLQALLASLWVVLIVAVTGAISGDALARVYNDPTLARDDYRGIVQFINATTEKHDAILLDAPGQAEVFNYYYQGNLPVFPLPAQRPIDEKATAAELAKLTGYNKVYVLYWAEEEADPGRFIQGWLDSRGYKTLDQWRGNVRLAVYVMPEQRPPDDTIGNLNLRLGGNITLLGYQAWNLAPHAGEVTQLKLLWRADQTPAQRYKVFVQLLDARDQVIAQRDAEPAGEARPTDGWQPGEVIEDNHGLLIPPGTPPGTYRRIVGLYDPNTGERLRLSTGEDHLVLPPITVARSAVAPPLAAFEIQHAQSFDFGGIKLLGYDSYKRGFKHAPTTPLYPSDLLHLTFYWQANVQPRADWWFDLTLSDSAGKTVAGLQAPLVGPTYSSTLWEKDEIVRGEHDLTLPADLPPDTYRLSLTLFPDTNTPAGPGSTFLGTIQVQRPAK